MAEGGSRGVGGLVEGGQLGEAPARRGAAQSVRALLHPKKNTHTHTFHTFVDEKIKSQSMSFTQSEAVQRI